MTPEQIAEIRARAAAAFDCSKCWELNCPDPEEAKKLSAFLNHGPADVRELLAALARAEWLVEELRGQRDSWKAMADRSDAGEF